MDFPVDAGAQQRRQALLYDRQLPNDQKLAVILDAIQDIGFTSLFKFLELFLTTKDKALGARAAIFARDSFLPLLKILLPRSRYAPLRRNTKRKTDTMSEELGQVLVPWASKFLAQEMSKLALDPLARLAPSEVCIPRR